MNEDTLDDEVKNFSVDVEENSKVELEDPNEFIEVKVKSNVVNLFYLKDHLKRTPKRFLKISISFPNLKLKWKRLLSISMMRMFPN